jgi:hypothetical protein
MSDLIDTSKQDKDKKKSDRRRERELNDIRKVLSSSEGRRFCWRVLSESGLYKTSFTGNSQTFFLEGRRSLGLFLLNELMSANATAFASMQQEHYSEKTSEELLRQKEMEISS